jgi:hypothetical protein
MNAQMDFTFDRGMAGLALFPRSGPSVSFDEVGRDYWEAPMKTHISNGIAAGGAESRIAIYRAIAWLENYIRENPRTDAAIEARSIIRELQGLRLRPGVAELLALPAQIAKSAGLEEIQKAKLRMGQSVEPEKNK